MLTFKRIFGKTHGWKRPQCSALVLRGPALLEPKRLSALSSALAFLHLCWFWANREEAAVWGQHPALVCTGSGASGMKVMGRSGAIT